MKELRRVVIKEELVKLTGDFKKAIILNQFIYWSNKTRDVDKYIREERERALKDGTKINIDESNGWIYKKADELSIETMLGLSASNISSHIKYLVENEWLHKRRNPKRAWDKTFQYRVNLIKIILDLKKLGFALEGYPINIEFKYDNSKIENRTSKTEIGTSETEIGDSKNTKISDIKDENTLKKDNKDTVYSKVNSETEIGTSKIENRTSKTEEQYQRLHTENTNKDYINNTSTNKNIHNDKEIEEGNKEINIEKVNYVEDMLRIKLNKIQQRIISTLDMDKLKRSVLCTSAYSDKSETELYKILIAIYNNPNNHSSRDFNTGSCSDKEPKYNGFNNFKSRNYDYDSLEWKLLGWEN